MKRNILTLILLSFLTLNLVAQESMSNKSLTELQSEYEKQSDQINKAQKQYEETFAYQEKKEETYYMTFKEEESKYNAAEKAYELDNTPQKEEMKNIAYDKKVESHAKALQATSESISTYINHLDNMSAIATDLLFITERAEELKARGELKNIEDIFIESDRGIVNFFTIVKDIEETSETLVANKNNILNMLNESSDSVDIEKEMHAFNKTENIPSTSKDMLTIIANLKKHKRIAMSMQNALKKLALRELMNNRSVSGTTDLTQIGKSISPLKGFMDRLKLLTNNHKANHSTITNNNYTKPDTSPLERKTKIFLNN